MIKVIPRIFMILTAITVVLFNLNGRQGGQHKLKNKRR